MSTKSVESCNIECWVSGMQQTGYKVYRDIKSKSALLCLGVIKMCERTIQFTEIDNILYRDTRSKSELLCLESLNLVKGQHSDSNTRSKSELLLCLGVIKSYERTIQSTEATSQQLCLYCYVIKTCERVTQSTLDIILNV